MFLLESIVYWQHLLPRHSWITVIWPIVFRRRSVGTQHWNNKDRAVYSERTTMSENWVLQHQVIWSYCTVFHTHRKINDSSSAFTQKKTEWKGWSGRVEIINSILLAGRIPAKQAPSGKCGSFPPGPRRKLLQTCVAFSHTTIFVRGKNIKDTPDS